MIRQQHNYGAYMTQSMCSFITDLRIMGRGLDISLTECDSQCRSLSPTGSYGLVTPIFEEQFIGIRDPLNFTRFHPIWLGLQANESLVWNRYSPKQTVHSLPKLKLWRTPPLFKLPVYYHDNALVVDPGKQKAKCVCEKGEDLVGTNRRGGGGVGGVRGGIFVGQQVT